MEPTYTGLVGALLDHARQQEAFGKFKPTPIPSYKLATSLGIEHTVMLPKKIDRYGDKSDFLIECYRSLLEEKSIERLHGPKLDGERAIETASSPFTDLAEISKWYQCMARAAEIIGFQPHDPKMISGGGHIHARYTPSLAMKAFRDILRRPYLLWVFNDPNDKGCNLFNEAVGKIDPDLIKIVNALPEDVKLDKMFDRGYMSEEFRRAIMYYAKSTENTKSAWLFDDKGYPLRWCARYDTLEFRFFDAPANWEEQKSHVMFVDAYTRWLKNQPMVPTENLAPKAIRKYTTDSAQVEFYAFCQTLDLNPDDYESQVVRNLEGWLTTANFGLSAKPRASRTRNTTTLVSTSSTITDDEGSRRYPRLNSIQALRDWITETSMPDLARALEDPDHPLTRAQRDGNLFIAMEEDPDVREIVEMAT